MSKFEWGVFYGGFDHFAVSKEKYTKEEAIEIYKREMDIPSGETISVGESYVRHRAGVNEETCENCPLLKTDKGKGFGCKLSPSEFYKQILSLIKELTEENDRLSTALAEYEYETNIRISEEYVHNEAYEELREENERLKAESEATIDDLGEHFDYKIYAKSMRVNAVKDINGNIICHPDLWEQIASIIERSSDIRTTVKKMQERLKKAFNFGHTILEKSICDIIDQIAKEMLEG